MRVCIYYGIIVLKNSLISFEFINQNEMIYSIGVSQSKSFQETKQQNTYTLYQV